MGYVKGKGEIIMIKIFCMKFLKILQRGDVGKRLVHWTLVRTNGI